MKDIVLELLKFTFEIETNLITLSEETILSGIEDYDSINKMSPNEILEILNIKP